MKNFKFITKTPFEILTKWTAGAFLKSIVTFRAENNLILSPKENELEWKIAIRKYCDVNRCWIADK